MPAYSPPSGQAAQTHHVNGGRSAPRCVWAGRCGAASRSAGRRGARGGGAQARGVRAALTLAPELIAIKVQVEDCTDSSVDVRARVLTETVEVYKCERTSVRLGAKAATLQVDKCTELALTFAQLAFFDRLMTTGARATSIAFEDDPTLGTTTIDFDALQALDNAAYAWVHGLTAPA